MKLNFSRINKNNITPYLEQIAPKQTEFKSTKALYTYAKKRITCVAKKINHEYLVVADTKNNKILCEKLGDKYSVEMTDILKEIPKDNKNIAILHGHIGKPSPLSMADCYFLCKNKFDKIIAFDKKGRFSMMQILPQTNLKNVTSIFKWYSIFGANCVPDSFFGNLKMTILNNYDKYCDKWLKDIVAPKYHMRYVSNMFAQK